MLKKEDTCLYVLHIDNSVRTTGAFKAMMNLIEELAARTEFRSVVAIPEKSQCDSILTTKDVPYVRFGFLELRKSFYSIVAYIPVLLYNIFKMIRYVKNNRICVLHNNDHFNLVPLFTKVILGKRVKLIVHVRLLNSTYNAALYGLFRWLNIKFADKIIGVSEAVYSAYNKPAQMVVVPDRINIKEKHGAFVLNEKPVPFRFLYLSNYIPGKGQNFALEAFTEVAQNNTAELYFYGGDMGLSKNADFKEKLIRQAEDKGVGDQVKFCSFSEDIEQTYKSFDVSLCFSESESFSLVCIESMFYGIPVIASACGGPSEIIDNGISGLLVENRNVAQMANAMKKLIVNKDLRSRLSHEGRKRSLEIINRPASFASELEKAVHLSN